MTQCLWGVAPVVMAVFLQVTPVNAQEQTSQPKKIAVDSVVQNVGDKEADAKEVTAADCCKPKRCCKPCKPCKPCKEKECLCKRVWEKKTKWGLGLRYGMYAFEHGSAEQDLAGIGQLGRRWSVDPELENVRLFFSGDANDYIGITINTDIAGAMGGNPLLQFGEDTFGGTGLGDLGGEETRDIHLLDAILRLHFSDAVNVWMGRFNLPIDRSNISGPFYINTWAFPFVALGYVNAFQARDEGVAYWGEAGGCDGPHVKWQAGIFRGGEHVGVAHLQNHSDHLMYAGRVTVNLLDPEPGYYNQSTYYGEKDILAIGFAFQSQQDAIVDGADFFAWNLDFLFEKALGCCGSGGVVTAESAFYDYEHRGNDPGTGLPFDPAFGREGEAYFVMGAYLFPKLVGSGLLQGRLQPYIRYQNVSRVTAAAGRLEEGYDFGLNYIIDGHNARLSMTYEKIDPGTTLPWIDIFRFGAQVQY